MAKFVSEAKLYARTHYEGGAQHDLRMSIDKLSAAEGFNRVVLFGQQGVLRLRAWHSKCFISFTRNI